MNPERKVHKVQMEKAKKKGINNFYMYISGDKKRSGEKTVNNECRKRCEDGINYNKNEGKKR